MNVIYVGNSIFAIFAFEKAAEEIGAELHSLKDAAEKAFPEITEKLIELNADYYVVDISCFSEDDEILARELDRLKTAVNCGIIIHAPMYNPQSKIILDLQAMGFTSVITALENQGWLKEEFIEAVKSFNEKEEPDVQEELICQRQQRNDTAVKELPQLEKLRELEERENHVSDLNKIMKIAVIGSREFIGTTTVAIQFIKYLNSINEASAAYIELNKSRYIKNLKEYFEVDDVDEKVSSITMGGVTMFENPRLMPEILAEGFSFYVFDYGSISMVNDTSSIYEKDIIILVGGVKANEIIQTTEAMKELYSRKNIFYILNHVPQRSRSSVRSRMSDKTDKTYFLESAFDPFVLNQDNSKIFNEILCSDFTPERSTKRKKAWRIFR